MKEIVVISGKGGTGKTSVLASLAALAGNAVMADCDVDAADLHLVLAPKVARSQPFHSGNEAVIRQDACVRCGACLAYCRYDAVLMSGGGAGEAEFRVDPTSCEGCGVCVRFCPVAAIDFPERLCGEWYVSETRFGPMAHAKLGIAAENSGKLVSLTRRTAKELATECGADWLLVDGPPGIGCPVIASITGADLVLVVSEPTVSGLHDLRRVLELAGHFKVPAAVAVNKADINPEMAGRIAAAAVEAGAKMLGEIPYDPTVTDAQIAAASVVEHAPDSPAAIAIKKIWEKLSGN